MIYFVLCISHDMRLREMMKRDGERKKENRRDEGRKCRRIRTEGRWGARRRM